MNRKIYLPVVTFILAGSIFIGCSKNKDLPVDTGITTSGVNNSDVAVLQDAESQDAVSDKMDQDVDSKIDVAESNSFVASGLKSGTIGYTVTIDKPATDTSTVVSTGFPKTITIVYNTSDTINGEHIKLSGTVTVKIDTIPVGKKLYWRSHLKRTITFQNLAISTDSSSFSINGTRTLSRLTAKIKFPDLLDLRTEIKDTITSDLSLATTYNNITKTITRKANKTRTSILYYQRASVLSTKWNADLKRDTVKFSGSITGVTDKEVSYSRIITSPIIILFNQLWPYNPIISSGTMTYKIGDSSPFTINYAADGTKTKASISRDGATKTIERKMNRKFSIWW